MNANYESEPIHPGESQVGHALRNACEFLVSLVCERNPDSQTAHEIHDLEEMQSAKEPPR
jgi:hypothetical protein